MVKHHFRCTKKLNVATKRREVNSHPQPMLGLTQGWMPGASEVTWSHNSLSVNVKSTVKVTCLLIWKKNVYQRLSISSNLYQCLSKSIKVYQYEKWYFTQQFVVIIHNSPPWISMSPKGIFGNKTSGSSGSSGSSSMEWSFGDVMEKSVSHWETYTLW